LKHLLPKSVFGLGRDKLVSLFLRSEVLSIHYSIERMFLDLVHPYIHRMSVIPITVYRITVIPITCSFALILDSHIFVFAVIRIERTRYYLGLSKSYLLSTNYGT
jgi:hypothetical protein